MFLMSSYGTFRWTFGSRQRTFEIELNIVYTVRLEIRHYQSQVRLAGLVAVTK